MKLHPIHAATVVVMNCFALGACDDRSLPTAADADEHGFTAASETTAAHNRSILQQRPFTNQQDFVEAQRGLIATEPRLVIDGANGMPVWDMESYAFVSGEAPATVNPSLWRQAKLNNIHGLFEVTDGVYQVRGYDLANMTLIEGRQGWIVVDPLTTAETAHAAIRFAQQHLGQKAISAILFTHSHVDHFGGVLGVLEESATDPDSVQIIAPAGFMEEATSENLLAGQTMSRRAEYMYGSPLPRSARGHVDTGLGKQPAFGRIGIFPPTELIHATGQRLEIDGVTFEFQIVSGSEAPAEFTFYLPDKKAFCGAEMVSRTMHNLYTLRGAKVRDALAWSGFIDEAITLFGEADVYFGSHHWPIWGQPQIQEFLETQRDTYKFIHDQTLRLAYKGYTPVEIVDALELPAALRQTFSNQDYYGTLRHNIRAVYQGYFGWYDGNPANLNPLPPTAEAERYVEAIGGANAVIEQAQAAFDDGDYRWVARLLGHLVFAQPDHEGAKALLAQTYDQLGYQSESGPWRDNYLSAAYELRHGVGVGADLRAAGRELVEHSPMANFFDVMAAQVNGLEAEGVELTLNLTFTDLDENHVLRLKNSVLNHRQAPLDENANATIRLTQTLFLDLALGSASMREVVMSDELSIEGSRLDLLRFFALQDRAEPGFAIVTP